jgi:hypothetical protein
MAFTELNDVPSRVNYRPVILRSAGTKSDFGTPVESIGLQKPENLLVKAQEQQMLRSAPSKVNPTLSF